MKQILSVLCLSIALSGCAAYQIHPGAISVTESKAYDVVSDANSTINVARAQFASGVLPVRLKPFFDSLVDAYNVGYKALKAYDDAVKAGTAADALLTKLNAAKAALDTALLNFKGAK